MAASALDNNCAYRLACRLRPGCGSELAGERVGMLVNHPVAFASACQVLWIGAPVNGGSLALSDFWQWVFE